MQVRYRLRWALTEDTKADCIGGSPKLLLVEGGDGPLGPQAFVKRVCLGTVTKLLNDGA